jgi:hypothetical protein
VGGAAQTGGTVISSNGQSTLSDGQSYVYWTNGQGTGSMTVFDVQGSGSIDFTTANVTAQ